MDTSDQSEHRLPHEEGYGSPTAEEEMASAEESAPASGTPEEAPSTDAEIEEGTTEQASPRESFSSESDEEGSGLPEQ